MRTAFIGIRISEEERSALRRIAEREERSPSDFVRRLIRKAVNENERQTPTVSQAVGSSAQAPAPHP